MFIVCFSSIVTNVFPPGFACVVGVAELGLLTGRELHAGVCDKGACMLGTRDTGPCIPVQDDLSSAQPPSISLNIHSLRLLPGERRKRMRERVWERGGRQRHPEIADKGGAPLLSPVSGCLCLPSSLPHSLSHPISSLSAPPFLPLCAAFLFPSLYLAFSLSTNAHVDNFAPADESMEVCRIRPAWGRSLLLQDASSDKWAGVHADFCRTARQSKYAPD